MSNAVLLLGIQRLKACVNELTWRGIDVEKAILTTDQPTVLLGQSPESLLSDTVQLNEKDGYQFIELQACRVCWRGGQTESE